MPSPAKCSSVPAELNYQRTHGSVVLAQHAEDFLWCGGIAERREPAQVAEHRGRLAAVAGKERLTFRRGYKRGDLGRKKATQLGLLALDGFQHLGLRRGVGDLSVM